MLDFFLMGRNCSLIFLSVGVSIHGFMSIATELDLNSFTNDFLGRSLKLLMNWKSFMKMMTWSVAYFSIHGLQLMGF